jgi:hypothetical protein
MIDRPDAAPLTLEERASIAALLLQDLRERRGYIRAVDVDEMCDDWTTGDIPAPENAGGNYEDWIELHTEIECLLHTP